MSTAAGVRPYANNYEHLEDELRWLDLLIRLKCRTLPLQNQTAAETQVARAAYITPGDVEWLLEKSATANVGDEESAALRAALQRLHCGIDQRVARSLREGVFLGLPLVCKLFGLSVFEQQAIVICLAPELRRKYDRLYAYLQDDITRQRPSVDLVLEMLCDTEHERWSARGFLADGAPLLRAGLLCKLDDPQSPSGSTGLSCFLTLDPRIRAFILGGSQIDARLAGKIQVYRPTVDAERVAVDPAITAGVLNLIEHHLAPDGTDKRKLVLHLHGPHGVGKRDLALHICRRRNSSLLSIDAELLLARGAEADSLVRIAFREGLVQQAFLYVEHADTLLEDSARQLLNTLQVAVSEYGWLVFLSGEKAWTHKHAFSGCRFHSAALPVPDVPLRAAVWARCLAGQSSGVEALAAQLATQFRLTAGQIWAAAGQAENRRLMEAEPRALTIADLAAACREQSNHRLRELATQIKPHYAWDDLVLPEDKLKHLREICNQVRHRDKIFRTWGFDKKLGHGKGLSALFSGPSGTGKTMAADVLAHELGLALYKVDLSAVVSKYIGETEKHLSRIFGEAESSNAILFFDEADALFGKRTEVSDAHDRYANIETSFLLQKMEEYEGVVIMATNLIENMDEAFTRRIRFIVDFPFPDQVHCLRIWKTHFPAEVPLSPGIDYSYLARELRVSGGNIKNIVLNAAFLAAENGGTVSMEHILHGSRREYEKMGKLWYEKFPAPAGAK